MIEDQVTNSVTPWGAPLVPLDQNRRAQYTIQLDPKDDPATIILVQAVSVWWTIRPDLWAPNSVNPDGPVVIHPRGEAALDAWRWGESAGLWGKTGILWSAYHQAWDSVQLGRHVPGYGESVLLGYGA